MKVTIKDPIRIEVDGRRCDRLCPHINPWEPRCNLFGKKLSAPECEKPFRCQECLTAEVYIPEDLPSKEEAKP